MSETKPGRRIQAVQIAWNIIEVLQEEGELGVTAIANSLGHSKSTVHSHLRTLEEERIVVRRNEVYRLSLRFLDISRHVRDQIGNYEIIRTEADELADQTGELVQFGVEEFGRVTYLYKATGTKSVQTASRVGRQQPMYTTALGKTILAHLPSKRQSEIIDSSTYDERTKHTITSPEELREELELTIERGYGIDDEENVEGLRCVAAPVLDQDSVLGAISISGPSSRISDERLHEELSEDVLSAANVIELNTKFH